MRQIVNVENTNVGTMEGKHLPWLDFLERKRKYLKIIADSTQPERWKLGECPRKSKKNEEDWLTEDFKDATGWTEDCIIRAAVNKLHTIEYLDIDIWKLDVNIYVNIT